MDKAVPISINVWELSLLYHKPISLEEKQYGDGILVKMIKGKVL